MNNYLKFLRKYSVVPVGLVLITAAFLKMQELMVGAKEDLIFANVLICVEVALAFGLLTAIRPHLMRWAGLGLFTIFSGYQLYQISIGAESCNCFGAVDLPPLATLAIDVVSLTLLWFWLPNAKTSTETSASAAASTPEWPVYTMTFLALIAVSLPIHMVEANTLADSGEIIGANGTVVIDPWRWEGKPLPILDHIQNGYPMNRGRWSILLYENDCSKCEKAIQEIRSDETRTVPMAFVSLSPAIGGKDSPLELWTHLSTEYRWITDVPAIIEIENSVVISVSSYQQKELVP